MKSVYFVAFEVLIYVLTAIYVVYCLRKGKDESIQFLTLVVFGFVLEIVSIAFTDVYHYSDFLVMIHTVPLCIGLMWGMILYSAMKATDRWGMPLYARPFLDGLLVLSVDLGIDFVATDLGFWNWHMLDWYSVWYGVPLGNFFLWFVFAFVISLIWRFSPELMSRTSLEKYANVLVPVLTVVLGLLAVLGANLIQFFPLTEVVQIALFSATIVVALSVVLHSISKTFREISFDKTPEWLVFLGPFVIHLFFFISMFLIGLHSTYPILPAISVAMMAVWAAVFLVPSLRSLKSWRKP
jgi:hypothetical protein